MSNILLEVKNLTVTLNKSKTLLDDVSFTLKQNQCLGIVGESGSGKSLTCKAIIGLLEPCFSSQGQIILHPQHLKDVVPYDLLQQSHETLRKVRGDRIASILQHPMSAFDPIYRIGSQVIETLQAHHPINRKAATLKTLQMMHEMGLENPKLLFNKYPHQLSGGMLQRIMIGIALLLEPDLIIADEPTTALDSLTQFQMLAAFNQIKQQSQTTLIFISHDLGVIHHIADHIIVMHQGCIVEQGDKEQIFCHPQSEYTRYLIATREQLMTKFKATIANQSATQGAD